MVIGSHKCEQHQKSLFPVLPESRAKEKVEKENQKLDIKSEFSVCEKAVQM